MLSKHIMLIFRSTGKYICISKELGTLIEHKAGRFNDQYMFVFKPNTTEVIEIQG